MGNKQKILFALLVTALFVMITGIVVRSVRQPAIAKKKPAVVCGGGVALN